MGIVFFLYKETVRLIDCIFSKRMESLLEL